MTSLICNAPFCENSRNYNHAWCSVHRWEREKFKIKKYKELLPLWAVKRCKKHGLLKPFQTYFHIKNNCYVCRLCKPTYNPIKNKILMQKTSKKRKDNRLKKRYKINLIEYNLLLKKQNYCCSICKITIEEHQKRKGIDRQFAVDHCHIINKIRGLLCYKCNLDIGIFNDSIHQLESAIEYLRRHKTA